MAFLLFMALDHCQNVTDTSFDLLPDLVFILDDDCNYVCRYCFPWSLAAYIILLKVKPKVADFKQLLDG